MRAIVDHQSYCVLLPCPILLQCHVYLKKWQILTNFIGAEFFPVCNWSFCGANNSEVKARKLERVLRFCLM